jgi:hypothetical protein
LQFSAAPKLSGSHAGFVSVEDTNGQIGYGCKRNVNVGIEVTGEEDMVRSVMIRSLMIMNSALNLCFAKQRLFSPRRRGEETGWTSGSNSSNEWGRNNPTTKFKVNPAGTDKGEVAIKVKSQHTWKNHALPPKYFGSYA